MTWVSSSCASHLTLCPPRHQHFQSILQTLEEQVSGERQRLVETHATRVIALINDQRRAALEGFLAALQGDPPQVWELWGVGGG